MLKSVCAFALLFAAFPVAAAPLPDLHRVPSPLPADLPRLAPLMGDSVHPGALTRESWEKRREELRAEWTRVLGEFPRTKTPLAPEFHEKVELEGYTRQRVTYQIEDDVRIDAMLLVPRKAAGRMPGIVLFHPTYANHYKRAVGMEGTHEPERAQAVQLVQQGYVVLAPRCFIYSELPPGYQKAGERIWEACTRWMRERHPGWRAITRMTWDGIRAIDFISTLPNVDPQRIGLFGHSLGAKQVIYVAAFDDRAKCTVSSEGGVGLTFSNWDAVWYLGPEIKTPGWQRENHELLAMTAPRPFLLLAGDSADNDRSWAFIGAALPVYQLYGSGPNLGWLNHRLGHTYSGVARTVAEAFLAAHLK